MPVCSEYALARLENTLSNVTVSALAMCMVRDKPTEKATEPCPWSPREVPPGPACAVKSDVPYVVNFAFTGWVEIQLLQYNNDAKKDLLFIGIHIHYTILNQQSSRHHIQVHLSNKKTFNNSLIF